MPTHAHERHRSGTFEPEADAPFGDGSQVRHQVDPNAKSGASAAVARVPQPSETKPRTVADMIELGLRQARRDGLEPTTLRAYTTSARCYVLPELGAVDLTELSAEHLDLFYGKLVDAGFSRSTVRGCHILLCRVLDHAKRWGIVRTNVARDARPPRQPGADPKPVPVDIARAMILESAETNPNLATLIVLASDTGARRGELCALRWRDFDEASRTVRIDTAIGETDAIYEKDTKNHQHRTVTLSAFASEWLIEHRQRQRSTCQAAGTDLSPDAFVLAPTSGGLRPLRPSSATRAFSRLRDRMELPSWIHLHGLRHLQVTQLLDAGIPLRSVSGRVGHRHPSTTANIYAHWIQESDRRAAQAVQDRIWEH